MRRAFSLAVAVAFLTTPSFAQKPRVHQIALVDGAGSATGRLKGSGQRLYSFESSGHSVAIEMQATPVRSIALELYDPEASRVFLVKEGAGRWTAPLSKPGRYELVVARRTTRAPVSSYRLRITIR